MASVVVFYVAMVLYVTICNYQYLRTLRSYESLSNAGLAAMALLAGALWPLAAVDCVARESAQGLLEAASDEDTPHEE